MRGVINAARCSFGVGFVHRYSALGELDDGARVELFPEPDMLNGRINNLYQFKDDPPPPSKRLSSGSKYLIGSRASGQAGSKARPVVFSHTSRHSHAKDLPDRTLRMHLA